MTICLAIDPGTTLSAYLEYDSNGPKILSRAKLPNEELLDLLWHGPIEAEHLAIEMVASMGMAVGREVYETVLWIGRFVEAWRWFEWACDGTFAPYTLVYRRDVKLHLCGVMRAKDANIRAALIDKLGPVGIKAQPGPCYGIHGDLWSALAVAIYWSETLQDKGVVETPESSVKMG